MLENRGNQRNCDERDLYVGYPIWSTGTGQIVRNVHFVHADVRLHADTVDKVPIAFEHGSPDSFHVVGADSLVGQQAFIDPTSDGIPVNA